MYTWKVTKTLTNPLDPEWEELASSCLGEAVHKDRKKGFLLSRDALKRSFKMHGIELGIKDLKLKEYHLLPQFPQYTFSLSHTKDFGAAIVGSRQDFLSVGIDIENASRTVKDSVLTRISHPGDLATLRKIEVWCLKEAVYKALMNSGKLPASIGFSSIQLQHERWIHSPSGLEGEWVLHETDDALVALAFVLSAAK